MLTGRKTFFGCQQIILMMMMIMIMITIMVDHYTWSKDMEYKQDIKKNNRLSI